MCNFKHVCTSTLEVRFFPPDSETGDKGRAICLKQIYVVCMLRIDSGGRLGTDVGLLR